MGRVNSECGGIGIVNWENEGSKCGERGEWVGREKRV